MNRIAPICVVAAVLLSGAAAGAEPSQQPWQLAQSAADDRRDAFEFDRAVREYEDTLRRAREQQGTDERRLDDRRDTERRLFQRDQDRRALERREQDRRDLDRRR